MSSRSRKKVIIIIARNKFRDEEYLEPRRILENAGVAVTVASSSLDMAEGMLGLKVKPDILVESVQEAEFDGIVFVGGGGSKEYFENSLVHRLARAFCEHGKLTSAICIAPTVLANAGLLRGKRATSFPSSESALKAQGAVVTGEDVTADGRIITAVGPEAAGKFGQKLVEILETEFFD